MKSKFGDLFVFEFKDFVGQQLPGNIGGGFPKSILRSQGLA
jgi:hypothetical protein